MKKVKPSDFTDYLEKQVGQPYLNNSERRKTALGHIPLRLEAWMKTSLS